MQALRLLALLRGQIRGPGIGLCEVRGREVQVWDWGRRADLEAFFEVVGGWLGGEVAVVGVSVGGMEAMFGDGEFGGFRECEECLGEVEDVRVAVSQGGVGEVGEACGGKCGGEGLAEVVERLGGWVRFGKRSQVDDWERRGRVRQRRHCSSTWYGFALLLLWY